MRIFALAMAINKVHIDEFLELAKTMPVVDVRSPGEYHHAHIPGAFSLPLFSNEERKVVGTAYKQESREKAIKIGLDYFGKKMVTVVEEAEAILKQSKNDSRHIGVHCWRGGMRSAAIAWLLDLYGFKVYLLVGGYKVYRHWVLEQYEKNYVLHVVGGYTGGNKTGIIHELKKLGEPVIDLEGLAKHMGSAFGNLDLIEQPSQEFFENLLATELAALSGEDGKTAIWLEGESQRIGMVNLPFSFYKNMRREAIFFMDIPFEKRLEHIIKIYGKFDKDKFISAIIRIKKKLGGLETKNAVNALLEDDIQGCFRILLHYYDKLYLKSTSTAKEEEGKVTYVISETTDAKLNTQLVLNHVRNGNY